MNSTHTGRITIDVYDVVSAGGVEQAIEAWCRESDDTASGVIGPSFSASGPGPGWSRQHDATDFAARAIQEGCAYYIDSSDGRMIEAEEVDAGYPGAIIGQDGLHYRLGDWTSESVVELVCPDIEDATDPDHLAAVAEMARAVIDYHRAKSDRAAWRKLIATIRNAAEAIEDIDLDELD